MPAPSYAAVVPSSVVASSSTNASASVDTVAFKSYRVWVKTRHTVVHQEPRHKSKIVQRVAIGYRFKVIGREGNWLQVGKHRFVYKSAVTRNQTSLWGKPAFARLTAYRMILHSHRWSKNASEHQYDCLYMLWMRESRWQRHAANSSGAYGIPQALPGHKMRLLGRKSNPGWRHDPTAQIKWGLYYIRGRYHTPCGAWAHSQGVGWY